MRRALSLCAPNSIHARHTISSLFLLKYDFPALYTVRLLEGRRDIKEFLHSPQICNVMKAGENLLKIANTITYQ